MKFVKYHKIHRLGKEETDGILEGECFIQEKIDGANASIWLDDDGLIQLGSRNRHLASDESFNGFREYVDGHDGIKGLLSKMPTARLYGEWLIKHSVDYSAVSYRKFYLFDIRLNHKWVHPLIVHQTAEAFGIEKPAYHGEFKNPTVETIKEFVGMSAIGESGEGVVIKNPEFVNKWGDTVYAKVVTEKFREANAITFGGNSKHSESYWEMYVCNKYITLARVEKIMNKLSGDIERFDMQHIPRICSTVYHDMITEEIWDIQKKVQSVSFKKLQSLCYRKIKQVYVDIINNSISIADNK